jgi:hypothetical protein
MCLISLPCTSIQWSHELSYMIEIHMMSFVSLSIYVLL